ncbi:cation:dicarboxylate symporter family transporter [Klebsiella pneumoniae]|nr:cation:dicarboxylase symporter family transporter [Klebsiella pneumoniae]
MKTSIFKSLYVQVLTAIAIGILLGHFYPELGAQMKPFGDAFVKLIKMVIAPVIFCTVVTGIAGMESMKAVGRTGAVALLYFEVVSTIALIIGLIIVNVVQPGAGMNVDPSTLDAKAVAVYAEQAKDQGVVAFLLDVIPGSVIGAFASGNILQVLLFAVLFGFALHRLGSKGQLIFNVIESFSQVIFGIINMIMRLAPIGAFGAMAFTIGKYGVGTLVQLGQLKDFYQKWYTPDAMTLIVVGNVDSRSVAEQINKTFGDLKGKRETPAAVPTLSPLPTVPVSIMTNAVRQDKLSIMWDAPWQPIRDSAALQRYWRDDLAREALFWHVQQSLSKNNVKDIGLGFDCRVLYQRAQCAINIDSPGERLNNNLSVVSRELAKVRDNGLPQEEFDALIAQKSLELQKLFATYARTDTDILMSQRMRSLQNQVVDIAPEQYQKLRQEFLNSLTVDMLNQYLRQQLSQDMALVLQQPKGEPEYNMKELQATWEKLMAPNPAATAASGSADTVDAHSEASDIPPGQ